jgi:hypothetical protein
VLLPCLRPAYRWRFPVPGRGGGTAHQVTALVVVVVVAGQHEVDTVLAEQRHPVLADAQVGAVRAPGGLR